MWASLERWYFIVKKTIKDEGQVFGVHIFSVALHVPEQLFVFCVFYLCEHKKNPTEIGISKN